jgi:bacterioferritin-associated ferredoxin
MKTLFIIMLLGCGMRASGSTLVEGGRLGRVMTRCECAELGFDEIARRLRDKRQTLEALQRETGCGRLCTACLPDLHDHLADRR